MARRLGTQTIERGRRPLVGPPILRASIGLPTSHVPPIATILANWLTTAARTVLPRTACRVLLPGYPHWIIKVRRSVFPFSYHAFRPRQQ